MTHITTDTTGHTIVAPNTGGYVYVGNTRIPNNTVTIRNHGFADHPDATSRINMEDMESPAFTAKIETLVGLWITRYGNDWVDLDSVMEDAFYGRVYKRLKALGELEVHFLTDRAKYVCRKPE